MSHSELEGLVGLQAERIAELEALVTESRARLDQNSRNSSRPPSLDGYAKLGRERGGQPGHQGHHLERREDPDHAIVHPVECCGRDLSEEPIVESRSGQVFDLPEVPALECVEHWIQKRRCECSDLSSSGFPPPYPGGSLRRLAAARAEDRLAHRLAEVLLRPVRAPESRSRWSAAGGRCAADCVFCPGGFDRILRRWLAKHPVSAI